MCLFLFVWVCQCVSDSDLVGTQRRCLAGSSCPRGKWQWAGPAGRRRSQGWRERRRPGGRNFPGDWRRATTWRTDQGLTIESTITTLFVLFVYVKIDVSLRCATWWLLKWWTVCCCWELQTSVKLFKHTAATGIQSADAKPSLSNTLTIQSHWQIFLWTMITSLNLKKFQFKRTSVMGYGN